MHNRVFQYVDVNLPKSTCANVSPSDIIDWVTLDNKALDDICLGVDDKIMYQIKKCMTSKEA